MTNKPQAFIFIGRSGCGKGTQTKLLMEKLKIAHPEQGNFYVQTGQEFRNYINKGTSETAAIARKIYETGGLLPEFLAVYFWSNHLAENYKLGEHLIIDGSPRILHEASILHSVFDFYKFEKPQVVYISVSKQWSKDRLLGRGRGDDNEADIEERLNWFEKEVIPVVEYYRNNPLYHFIEVNGEAPIEQVHMEVMAALSKNNGGTN